jgi:hypothetical protein
VGYSPGADNCSDDHTKIGMLVNYSEKKDVASGEDNSGEEVKRMM